MFEWNHQLLEMLASQRLAEKQRCAEADARIRRMKPGHAFQDAMAALGGVCCWLGQALVVWGRALEGRSGPQAAYAGLGGGGVSKSQMPNGGR